MVKASASRAEDPGFNSRLRCGDFCGSSHTSDLKIGTPVATLPVLAYLCPSLLVEHRPSTTPPPSRLLWSFWTSWSPAVTALLQCLASNCCKASLSLPLRVPGQGLACGAGCCLPEGVSDPVPLPPQYLLGHWFLSRSLPQIFISNLLLPLDFVDAP